MCKKDLPDPDNHDGVITHLEPDILECEVKWALGNITLQMCGQVSRGSAGEYQADEQAGVARESEKAGLKLNIQKAKIMVSGPITSWQIDGETVKTVADFIFLGPKITADGDCSREIKTLTPWKESYDQPRWHIQKQRHYFANKGSSSQGYGFSSGHVWM